METGQDYIRKCVDTHLQNTIDECIAYINLQVKTGEISRENADEEIKEFYIRVAKMATENL